MILEAHDYRVQLQPENGATLLSATWKHPDGRIVELLERLEMPEAGFQGGCFVMAPFVNRIADGRFHFEGKDYHIPLNRPQSGMAIHGFSRDRQWQVVSAKPDQATFQDRVSSPDHPWCYTITLDVSIRAEAITLTLTLLNDGAVTLPFGMGLHPFIPCDPQTTINFRAAGEFSTDNRGLPVGPVRVPDHFGRAKPERIQAWRGTDQCYYDWLGQIAEVGWPDRDAVLTIRAEGAFRHLHVYVLAARNVFCIEPVSHLPDAINRPDLGLDAAMTALGPGENMIGSMSFTAEPYRGL